MLFIRLSSIDSTSTFLKQWVQQTKKHSAIGVWAEHQTHGKGRMGTQWHATKGLNVTGSIYLGDISITNDAIFEINKRVKLNSNKADLLYEINSSDPIYVKNINISGNTRTQDYVIRRVLDISEGDAFLSNDTNFIRTQINSLGFFENVEVKQRKLDGNLVDIDINIKENQTGTFTAGASFGTLDGVTLVTGINENNIAVKRPGGGISPMKWDEVLGTNAIKDYDEDEKI